MLTVHRVTEILRNIDMYDNMKVYDALMTASDESHAQCMETVSGIVVGVCLELTSPRQRVKILGQYCMGCGKKRPCECYKKSLSEYVNSDPLYPERPLDPTQTAQYSGSTAAPNMDSIEDQDLQH